MAKRKVHETKKFWRVRLEDPKKFHPKSFRTIDPGRPKKTMVVVACPKSKYDTRKKRCKVGMQPQAILEEK